MPTIHPHINFNGNAEEAFTFYQSVFGSAFTKVMRFKDIASAEFPVSDAEANKLMHITLPIGTHTLLIGNDVPEFMGKVNERENRSKIFITAETKEEAGTLFSGLSVEGEVEVPLEDSPLGSCFAMFRDKYGIEWEIEYTSSEAGASAE